MLRAEDRQFIKESVSKGYKVRDIAKIFNVTPRRIQQILKDDSESSDEKKNDDMDHETEKQIMSLWSSYKIGSRTMYYYLRSQGFRVSYYQIYNFMRNNNMIRSRDKQNRELMEMKPFESIYLDYYQPEISKPYAVVLTDWATRKIIAMVEGHRITKELLASCLSSLKEIAMNTDLGDSKLSLRSGILSIVYSTTDLPKYMQSLGIGKVIIDKGGNRIHLSLSKLWQIYEKYRDDFPSAEEFVNWYNNRPMIRGGRSVVSPNSLMRDEVESEDRLYANNVTK
ncbi:MAG: IS481 family transposase [Thermoplasmataceae archaeon]|jgi:putative transposase